MRNNYVNALIGFTCQMDYKLIRTRDASHISFIINKFDDGNENDVMSNTLVSTIFCNVLFVMILEEIYLYF